LRLVGTGNIGVSAACYHGGRNELQRLPQAI
jgi:hypothetical protein